MKCERLKVLEKTKIKFENIRKDYRCIHDMDKELYDVSIEY